MVKGFRRVYLCDTQSELPGSGLRKSDTAYAKDTDKWFEAASISTWMETAWATAPGGGTIPAGLIAMWSGLLANMPAGWALCDGQNGTPDLRSKFVKGAAAGVDPGATGGAATHTHDPGTLGISAHAGTAVTAHPSHTHDYTQVLNHTHPVTDPGHAHTQRRHATTTGSLSGLVTAPDTSSSNPQTLGPTTSVDVTGVTTQNPAGGVATGTTAGPSAALTHSVTQPDAHTVSGATASASSEPAYYALAFIMKT